MHGAPVAPTYDDAWHREFWYHPLAPPPPPLAFAVLVIRELLAARARAYEMCADRRARGSV